MLVIVKLLQCWLAFRSLDFLKQDMVARFQLLLHILIDLPKSGIFLSLAICLAILSWLVFIITAKILSWLIRPTNVLESFLMCLFSKAIHLNWQISKAFHFVLVWCTIFSRSWRHYLVLVLLRFDLQILQMFFRVLSFSLLEVRSLRDYCLSVSKL